MASPYNFWKDKRLTPEEQNRELVETVKRVFGTEEGKVALNMLLNDLYFFHDAQTDVAKSLNEYAKFFIRERLGMNDTKSVTDFIVDLAANRGGSNG